MTIKNIVVVGGGTAGWAAACYLRDTTNPQIKVTVVASKEIPIIGVGESTTGLFNDFLKQIGLPEQVFMKETGATHKIGIQHRDWYKVGEHFNSPIGEAKRVANTYPSDDYDFIKMFAIAENINDSSLQAFCMKKNKVPFVRADHPENNPYKQLLGYGGYRDLRDNNTALHLDTYKTGQILKRFFLEKKVNTEYVEGTVDSFEKNEDGTIKCVKGKNNLKVEGDLFVDCSGFTRILLNSYENKFIEYGDQLLNNRALAFHIPYTSKTAIRSYTHAWAQKYGWLWMIPLQERYGAGYCFNDSFTTVDEAKLEIEKVLRTKIEVQKDIKFKSGRFEKFWIKNVISTGLSSAFIEPLEATSIHATLYQLKHWIRYYFTQTLNFNNEHLQDSYNDDMTNMWDQIKDFIVYHYITPRNDTEYWKEASSPKRWSKELKQKLGMWKDRTPRLPDFVRGNRNDFYHIDDNLWLNISQGMHILDRDMVKRELIEYNQYESAKRQLQNGLKFFDYASTNCVGTNEYYKHYVGQ
jgi:tryptophan halogenase